MTKRQVIDEILSLNQTADPAFLARFEACDLEEYAQHLEVVTMPRLTGDASRYEKYFVDCPVGVSIVCRPVPAESDLPDDIDTQDFDQLPADGLADDEEVPQPSEVVLTAAAVGGNETHESLSPFAETDDQEESWLF